MWEIFFFKNITVFNEIIKPFISKDLVPLWNHFLCPTVSSLSIETGQTGSKLGPDPEPDLDP